jgi:hypothetical protein
LIRYNRSGFCRQGLKLANKTGDARFLVFLFLQLMEQVNDLGSILLGMGNSADEIAVTLRTAGVQGVRNTVRFLNPIVRYCQSRLILDSYALDVMRDGILRIHLPDNVAKDFPLPVPLVKFLDAFNRGMYPDLELSSKGDANP